MKRDFHRKIIVVAVLFFLVLINFPLCADEGSEQVYTNNQKGIELLNQGQFAEGITYLKAALSYDPQNKRIAGNLSVALSRYGDQLLQKGYAQSAIEQFQNALYYDSTNTYALFNLGMAYYKNQDLKKAKEYFERLHQTNPSMQQAAQMIERINREGSAESGLQSIDSSHFTIVVSPGATSNSLASIRVNIENAYGRVGSLLNHYPAQKVTVIVFPNQDDFSSAYALPPWSAAVFDGKMRIPDFQGTRSESAIAKLIYHEFAHALVFDIAGTHVPTWMNEGIAMLCEELIEKKNQDIYRHYVESFSVPSLQSIPNDFSGIRNADQVHMIYIASYFAVKIITEKVGWSGLNQILALLGQGHDQASALQSVLGIDFPTFEDYVRRYIRAQVGLPA